MTQSPRAPGRSHSNRLGQVVRRLWRALSPHRRRQLFLVLALMVAGALAEVMTLGAIIPFLTVVADSGGIADYRLVTAVTDLFGLTNRADLLPAFTVIFAAAAVVAGVIRIVLTWASNKYVFMVGYDLGTRPYERILHQPYSFHISTNTSEIVASLQKVQLVTSNVLLPLMQGISSIFISVFIIAALFAVDPVTSSIAFAGFGLIYAGVWLFTKSRLRVNGEIIARTQSARFRRCRKGSVAFATF